MLFNVAGAMLERVKPVMRGLVVQSNQSTRHRVALLGFIAMIFYLPTWLGFMWSMTLSGSSYPLLNFACLFLGLQVVLRHSKRAEKLEPSSEDVYLGALAIVGCCILFFISLSSASLQAISSAGILVGILLSLYGGSIFACYPLKLTLFLVSLYPNLGFPLNSIRQLLVGDLFERISAVSGGWALNLIGQEPTVEGIFIHLGDGAVKVDPGCTGFDMAIAIAGLVMLLGFYLKLRWTKTVLLVAIGVGLSLLLNIPRIMILANASVYWGEDSFYFWHNSWGGQIFSGILFTIYYYIAMPIIGDDALLRSD